MRKWAPMLAVAALVAGCAGSEFQLSDLERGGDLAVAGATAPGYDYTVSVRRTRAPDFDTIDKGTRDDIALRYMRHQCPAATIVGENAIDQGETDIGVKRATYMIRVKCN